MQISRQFASNKKMQQQLHFRKATSSKVGIFFLNFQFAFAIKLIWYVVLASFNICRCVLSSMKFHQLFCIFWRIYLLLLKLNHPLSFLVPLINPFLSFFLGVDVCSLIILIICQFLSEWTLLCYPPFRCL